MPTACSVGLVYCRAGAMLIDTGSTLTEARADSDPVAWQATLERVIEAGGEGAVFVPGTAPWSTRRSSDATETGCARKCDESQTADVT